MIQPRTVPSVVVAVTTCRRSEALTIALASLRRQLTQVPGSRLVVVDYDVEPSAASVVEPVAALDRRIRYLHRPGTRVEAARKDALDAAAGADLLVILDGEEQPGERWLAALVSTWHAQHQPAAVVGPVVPIFQGDPDPWVTAGGFFSGPRHVTGDEVVAVRSNNLLLDLSELQRLDLPFDPSPGFADAPDTVISRRLSSVGGRIVWCDEAVVFDPVPLDRATRRWVQDSTSRSADCDLRARVSLARPGLPRLAARLRGTLAGAARLVGGGLRLAYGRLLGSLRNDARGTGTALRGAGMVRGAWGQVAPDCAG